ncbi:putative aminoadipate reductase [Mycena maculata]|uniref:Aminoadipate reductase n=1 Tax=Mycena maculata TaxID=230809 RepID=A0AAD7J9B8_9AGAR|nr:putative aminoadipate reductase [Mycena maculata]
MTNILPPLDCSLDISEIIDFHIGEGGRIAAYAFANADNEITEISRFEFGRAAHRVAHLLRPQRRGPEGQVLAIIALTDVLIYQAIVAGCIVAGIVPFPISNRNSATAVLHLLNTTDSHRLLMTKGSLSSLVDSVSADLVAMSPLYELSIQEIPLLGQIYPHLGHETAEHAFVPYPSPATRAKLDAVAMYLHSSGSTGLPKPIPQTHRNLIHCAALDTLVQMAELSPRQAVGALPAFHTMGVLNQLFAPLLNGVTACIYAPVSTATAHNVPVAPTAENALANARRARATGIVTVPALISEWQQSSEDVEYLKTLKLVIYGGGPLASRVGDALFGQGINLVSAYGTTEIGGVTIVKRRQAEIDAGEWAWIRFSPRVNIRWIPQEDGTFECQFLTVPETHQLAVENLSDVKGYSTKDLFERHPTKPDLYRIVGRLDDVLIMANGEKTVPGPIEDILMASSFIRGAIMFGRERNQIGVLVEPNPQHTVHPSDENQLANFRNLIWPSIEEANANSPAFARIYKEMILVTQPGKPMLRAPKGTVNKKATIALYNGEIEALYDTIEASGNAANDSVPPASWTAEDLEPWLRTQASVIADRDIRGGQDLFEQGFDSLNATFLRHRIVGALKNSADLEEAQVQAAVQNIPQNFVYSHPSIEKLAKAMTRLVHGHSDGFDDRKAILEKMIAKYSQGFDAPILKSTASFSGNAVVLLTGSTGGLGSHLLEMLLDSASVERVYAFNRKGRTPLSERQHEAFADRALDVKLLSSEKLVYLEGDASRSDLALPADVWTALRDSVTAIIHNAWMLDFNKSLSSFESHVKGTRNLIDLARQSPNGSQVRFLFTSSVGSAQGWDLKLGPFPEELQFDANVAVGNGYGESKYVSERILAASGLEATSFRIGQITGAAGNGAWSTTDWVPVIVKSSIVLGKFPSDPSAVVAWIRPEAISRTIVDTALSTEKAPFAINLVHPHPVPWDTVVSSMANFAQLPLIPFADWIQQLKTLSTHASAEDIKNIPGIKLLDFFTAVAAGQGNTQFTTIKAEELSNSMKFLKPLSEDDVHRWMKYWKEKGFIA